MNIFGIEISNIVDLTTQVATTGAIRAAELIGDDIFEYIIGVAIVIYEMDPA